MSTTRKAKVRRRQRSNPVLGNVESSHETLVISAERRLRPYSYVLRKGNKFMKSKSFWMVLSMAVWLGCDTGNNVKVAIPSATAVSDDESLPNVAHPEFANWNQFPEKSFVVRRKVVSNSNGEVVATTKVWLESKSVDGVFVGSQITVKRPDMPLVDNGADLVRYPAVYRLPKGLDENQFYKPSMKAKETGKEVVKIGKLDFQATIYEWEESSEAGPTSVKLWRSDEIPGKLLRQEMFTKSSETTSIEEVTEINLGEEQS